jgi:integrase
MYFQKRQRKKGIVWTVYIEYKDIYGRKQTYSKGGFKTKKEAQKHGIQKENELQKGINIKTKKYTLNEVFNDYMNVVGYQKLSKNGQYIYSSLYNNHVKNSIGQRLIDSLIYRDLQEYFNGLNKSKKTCQMIKSILSVIFKYAIKNGYVDTNPVRDIEIVGNGNKRNVRSITYEEFNKIIEYTLTKQGINPFLKKSYAYSFYIGYFLGLRISETLALNKSDFDFDNDTVTINKQLVTRGLKKADYHTTDKMKTKDSKAVLPIPLPLKNVLIPWFNENPYEIATPDQDGLYITPTVLDTFIKRTKNDLNIDFCYHSFRHSCASNLVKHGIDVATVSKIIRHSNITTTLNVYTDAKNEDMKEAVETVFNNDFYKKPSQNLTKTNYNALN